MLPLLLLAACSRAPDMTNCRLVGTWKAGPRFTDGALVQVDWSETFFADGKWIGEGSCGGHDLNLTWTLLDDSGDRVTIRMNEYVVEQVRTFVFESPDWIREEGGAFPGSKYNRVKQDTACDLPTPDTHVPSPSPK